ncbi:transposon protein, putative, CACTA, En/Spm sub-class, expressed [Cucumis melo var. makuwa]|uniref:Transposon protein, putative, CACTA, En/Spm sub-class, expressed n=1 Tax=Cucumis melo var. makuwa TaxID=1194695 RepID=A0A5D3CCI9_CUCMM|nr:transposon protein, putative, CACTA, En/Spm sub-class, expressed [Cucumis melo var. makuwa]TYK08908.1 transposon protein, putative, CACTA, En/Spm sub-class, expressed [Cucumis melo var. makuwa]
MHIEKNVCDFLVGTLLNIEGKTKDTTNAQLDLQDLKIRKDLHLVEVDNRLVKPHASYTLTSSERVEFCKFLKSVKFPDGFVSNISRSFLPKNVYIAQKALVGTQAEGPQDDECEQFHDVMTKGVEWRVRASLGDVRLFGEKDVGRGILDASGFIAKNDVGRGIPDVVDVIGKHDIRRGIPNAVLFMRGNAYPDSIFST